MIINNQPFQIILLHGILGDVFHWNTHILVSIHRYGKKFMSATRYELFTSEITLFKCNLPVYISVVGVGTIPG